MVVSFFENLIVSSWTKSPVHLITEAFMFVAIILLLLKKPEPIKKDSDDLNEQEEDEIISKWKPNPPVPDEIPEEYDLSILDEKIVTSRPTDKITVNDIEAINFGTSNFLGLNCCPEIMEASQKAIDHYAVGACGPRQFYGTMDCHLEVEKSMSNWLGSEDSVNYCFPFATTTSIIQAFCHNTDVVFIDEQSWFAVKIGAELTRGNVVLYKHNDMNDLRDKIIQKKNTFSKWHKCNRWIVAEGICMNDGSICELPTIINLRHEFFLRIIIDETNSIGVLGETGKGICEHYNINRDEIEIIIGSYATSLASLGGFSISTKELCGHQRLSSHAYIFSASPPPYIVVAAAKAIEIVEKNGKELINKLRSNTKLARELLKGIKNLEILGDEISPFIHLRLTSEMTLKEEHNTLQEICNKALQGEKPVFIVKSKFNCVKDPMFKKPTIKIYISAAHSEDQISDAVSTIKNSVESVFSK